MVEDTERNPHRLVEFTTAAFRDQSVIYAYSARQWGESQAEKYLDFLDTVAQALADDPKMAPLVPQRTSIRLFVARWENARDGHRIFFRETDEGILVLRILHTSMKWQDHLDQA